MTDQTNDQVGAGTDEMLAAQISEETIAKRINEEHRKACEARTNVVEHARHAGELLRQEKQRVGHGGWGEWLKANFAGSERTAQAYMRLAKRWPKLEANPQSTTDLTLDSALRILSHPKRSAATKVDDELAPLDRALDRVCKHAEREKVVARIIELVKQRLGICLIEEKIPFEEQVAS